MYLNLVRMLPKIQEGFKLKRPDSTAKLIEEINKMEEFQSSVKEKSTKRK